MLLAPLFSTEFKKMPLVIETDVSAAIVVLSALVGKVTPLLLLPQISAVPPMTLVETATELQ